MIVSFLQGWLRTIIFAAANDMKDAEVSSVEDEGTIMSSSVPLICYHGNEVNGKFTSVIFDFAVYTEEILKYRSWIIFPLTDESLIDPQLLTKKRGRYHKHSAHASFKRIEDKILTSFAERFNASFYYPGKQDLTGNTVMIASASPTPAPTGEGYNLVKHTPSPTPSPSRTPPPTMQPVHRIIDSHIRSGGENLISHAFYIGCDIVFILKSGSIISDPKYPDSFDCGMNTAVLAVNEYQRHGSTYATVNSALHKKSSRSFREVPKTSSHFGSVVPFVVRPLSKNQITALQSRHLPKSSNLKHLLDISSSTLLLCRTGNWGAFDVPWVQEAVLEVANVFHSSQLRFAFFNTKNFIPIITKGALQKHSSIDFLPGSNPIPGSVEAIHLGNLISSCDAMLHGTLGGEIFGIHIAEFSIRGKPIITYPGEPDNHESTREHLRILGDKAFVYKSKQDLLDIVSSLVKNGIPRGRNFTVYTEFTPERVMQVFDQVLLKPILLRLKGDADALARLEELKVEANANICPDGSNEHLNQGMNQTGSSSYEHSSHGSMGWIASSTSMHALVFAAKLILFLCCCCAVCCIWLSPLSKRSSRKKRKKKHQSVEYTTDTNVFAD